MWATSWRRVGYLAAIVGLIVTTGIVVVVGTATSVVAWTFPDMDNGTSGPHWTAVGASMSLTIAVAIGGAVASARVWRGFRRARIQTS